MAEKHAVLQYKCRMCGRIFDGQHADPNFTWWVTALYSKHNCSEGRWGIADLIGWNIVMWE